MGKKKELKRELRELKERTEGLLELLTLEREAYLHVKQQFEQAEQDVISLRKQIDQLKEKVGGKK